MFNWVILDDETILHFLGYMLSARLYNVERLPHDLRMKNHSILHSRSLTGLYERVIAIVACLHRLNAFC